MCSVARCSAVRIFSISGFHRFLATMPVSSETSKAERRSVATMVLSGTRGPWLFRVIREGLGSAVRLSARSTQQPNLPVETLSRTRVFREDPYDGADSVRGTQAVCGFRYWASKLTPFFQTINAMVAILRASVRRAISGLMPLASKAA